MKSSNENNWFINQWKNMWNKYILIHFDTCWAWARWKQTLILYRDIFVVIMFVIASLTIRPSDSRKSWNPVMSYLFCRSELAVEIFIDEVVITNPIEINVILNLIQQLGTRSILLKSMFEKKHANHLRRNLCRKLTCLIIYQVKSFDFQ